MSSRKPNSLEPAHNRVVDDVPSEDDVLYNGETTERASLLPTSGQRRGSQTSSTSESEYSARNAFTLTIAISALLMLADVTNLITLAPRMAIFEDIICSQHYATLQDMAGVADCKIEPVQSELARVNGWKRTFNLIPGLVFSIPYGVLADRVGRSKVLSLALSGVLLNEIWTTIVCALPQVFPLRAVWFSGVFTLVGGGPATVVAMCYAIISDACRPHQRTTAFSSIYAGFLISDMISTPLGAAFIATNPWIPLLAAVGIRLTFTLVVIGVTIRYRNVERFKDPSMLNGHSSTTLLSPQISLRDRARRVIADLAETAVWMTKDVILLIVAFFFIQISRESTDLLLQYSSLKVHWDYAKASYLITLRSAVNIFVLFALVPVVSHLFRRKGVPSSQVDKYVTVTSGIFLTLGSFLIFTASTPASLILGQTVIALGFAFTVTARSFMMTLASSRYLGVLSMSVGIASHGAIAVGGPLLAWTFKAGLDLGGVWIGMPFLVDAGFFAAGTLAVLCATAPHE